MRTSLGSSLRRLIRGFGVEIRPGEGMLAATLFIYFFLVVTFQYISKTVRQAGFIDQLGAEKLPVVYLVLALCTVPVLWAYGRVADRVKRQTLIAVTSLLVAASMVGFWWLYRYDAAWIRVAFYVWVSIVYVLNVSQFWSYSHHVLDPRQAKRLFGFIGAGGLVGGIAGGQMARIASRMVDARFPLLVSAAFLVVTAGLVLWIQRRYHPQDDEPAPNSVAARFSAARGGMGVILGSRHLTLIAAIMLLTIVVASVVDVQFNWAMEVATADFEGNRLDALTGGYGNFYTLMGSMALVIQLLFAARIHRHLGVGIAMGILPVTMALGTMGLFVAASLLPAAMLTVCRLLKVGEAGIRYSLDQTTRELLFLPVPAADRIKAKAYIDVFVQRSGKAVGGILLLPVTLGLISVVGAGWISLGLIVVWLALVVAAKREYVKMFRDCLKRRAIDSMAPIDVSDVTTLEMLTRSLGSADPRQVLHAMDLLAANRRGSLVTPLLLHHGSADVRLKTLGILADAGREDATPLIEKLLADDDPAVRAEAIRTLGELRKQDVSEVVRPRLDDPHPGVRAAAAVCAMNQGDEALRRCAALALTGLSKEADAECRIEAARAFGEVAGDGFVPQLIRLLYDVDVDVVRAAIAAVRRAAERDGYNPLFPPILISLLQRRRLKHDSREALVAFGERVLPTLMYFLADREESLWVRRALPKTIALVGTPAASRALLDSLEGISDLFLRRKVFEALGKLDADALTADAGGKIERAIHDEAARYWASFSDLSGLEEHRDGRFQGPLIVANDAASSRSLLGRLLAERMADHLRNVFRLLAVMHPGEDLRAAFYGIVNAKKAERARALEYLDNTIKGPIRRRLLPLVGDQPLEDKVRQSRRETRRGGESRTATLRRIIEQGAGGHDAGMLSAAAMYAVHTERIRELYPAVSTAGQASGTPFLKETAEWVTQRADSVP